MHDIYIRTMLLKGASQIYIAASDASEFAYLLGSRIKYIENKLHLKLKHFLRALPT